MLEAPKNHPYGKSAIEPRAYLTYSLLILINIIETFSISLDGD